MWEIQFGVYACSPENSSFKATFTNFQILECQWLAHNGQNQGNSFMMLLCVF